MASFTILESRKARALRPMRDQSASIGVQGILLRSAHIWMKILVLPSVGRSTELGKRFMSAAMLSMDSVMDSLVAEAWPTIPRTNSGLT